jgi:hypothetical protein
VGARVVRDQGFIGIVAEREWDAVQAAERLKVTWFAVDLYGVFPVKRLFFGFCSQFFVRSGKGRSSSRRLRSGSRSARKGSRDRNASAAWRRAALASQRLDA